MIVYIYLILLLLVLLSVLSGINLCLRCPKRIRILSFTILILLFLRYVSLFIMYINNNIGYMYIMKSIYFVYLACIPISGIIILYILSRKDNIKFLHITIGSFTFLIMYFLLFPKVSVSIGIIKDAALGYSMNLQNNFLYIGIVYFALNIVLLMFYIDIINSSNTNRTGMILAVCSSLSTVTAVILPYIGIEIMPQYLWGEFMWIITLNYCLSKVKKK